MNGYLKSDSKVPHNLRCFLVDLQKANAPTKNGKRDEEVFLRTMTQGKCDELVWHGLKLLDMLKEQEG